MQFKQAAIVGLAAWATLGAPNMYIEEAEADHPAVAIAAIGAAAFVTGVSIIGVVAIHAIDNGVGLTGSVDVDGVGSADINVGNGGGGDGGGGEEGGGGGPQQMSLPGAWASFPADLPFTLPDAFKVDETFGYELLPGEGVRFQSNPLWDADVLTPGYNPTVVNYDVKRLGEATFTRPAGSDPGASVLVDLQVDIDGLHVSTSPVPQTHGFAGYAYRVTSPQLGVLFETGGSVHQGQMPEYFGVLQPSMYQSMKGEFFLPSYHENLKIEIPGDYPVVDIVWELKTFGTGMKEQGAPLDLSWSGGLVGDSLTYDVSGDPGEFVLLFSSLSQGQFPLGLLDGVDPRWLSLGPKIDALSGFMVLDGEGKGTRTYPIPDVAALAGLEIHAQAVSAPGKNTFFDALSAPVTVTLADQGTQYATKGDGLLNRRSHVATTLDDGRVLVTGGLRANGTGDLRIAAFDADAMTIAKEVQGTIPADQSYVVAQLAEPRINHQAIVLANGDILIFGGTRPDGSPLATTERVIVNADGTLEVQPDAGMPSPRYLAGVTRLADGNILVTGGAQDVVPGSDAATFSTMTDEVLLFDGRGWMPIGHLPTPVMGHGQSLMGDGSVMITGGVVPAQGPGFVATAESYKLKDVTSGSFSLEVDTPMFEARAFHTQVPNGNGGAFIAGGGQIVPNLAMPGAFDMIPLTGTVEANPAAGAGYAATGLTAGANLPTGLIGKTLCCFCYGPDDGYFTNWCCCFPCLGPIGDGPIIIDPTPGGTETEDVALFASSQAGGEAAVIGQTLFDRTGGTVTKLPGKQGAVLLGGGEGPQAGELLITGDATGL